MHMPPPSVLMNTKWHFNLPFFLVGKVYFCILINSFFCRIKMWKGKMKRQKWRWSEEITSWQRNKRNRGSEKRWWHLSNKWQIKKWKSLYSYEENDGELEENSLNKWICTGYKWDYPTPLAHCFICFKLHTILHLSSWLMACSWIYFSMCLFMSAVINIEIVESVWLSVKMESIIKLA